MDNATLATELKTTLSKFNRGIRSVEIATSGLVTVCTKIRKSAIGVRHDLLLSGGFSNVSAAISGCGTLYIISAMPK